MQEELIKSSSNTGCMQIVTQFYFWARKLFESQGLTTYWSHVHLFAEMRDHLDNLEVKCGQQGESPSYFLHARL